MKAQVTFSVLVEIEAPDELTEQVNALTNELGENGIHADASPQDIMEHLALIMGLRGLDHAEIMYPEMSEQVKARVVDSDQEDFQWLEIPK